MEKRSRQRVRDQVALMAFGAESRMRSSARGYPSWPGTETFRSRAGYRSARPITSRSSLSACNARPVHTEGPAGDIRHTSGARACAPHAVAAAHRLALASKSCLWPHRSCEREEYDQADNERNNRHYLGRRIVEAFTRHHQGCRDVAASGPEREDVPCRLVSRADAPKPRR